MSASESSKKKDAAIDLGKTFHPGEPLPKPHVVVKDSNSAWALFQALQEGRAIEEFVTTTQQAGALPRPGAANQPGIKPLTADEVLFEARRNNRVCPLPSHWQRLHDQLLQAAADAPPPVGVKAWRTTPSIEKRLVLRKQVEWAAGHGALETLFDFLRELPEDKWQHMGD